jgi:hypothetical protein
MRKQRCDSNDKNCVADHEADGISCPASAKHSCKFTVYAFPSESPWQHERQQLAVPQSEQRLSHTICVLQIWKFSKPALRWHGGTCVCMQRQRVGTFQVAFQQEQFCNSAGRC